MAFIYILALIQIVIGIVIICQLGDLNKSAHTIIQDNRAGGNFVTKEIIDISTNIGHIKSITSAILSQPKS